MIKLYCIRFCCLHNAIELYTNTSVLCVRPNLGRWQEKYIEFGCIGKKNKMARFFNICICVIGLRCGPMPTSDENIFRRFGELSTSETRVDDNITVIIKCQPADKTFKQTVYFSIENVLTESLMEIHSKKDILLL